MPEEIEKTPSPPQSQPSYYKGYVPRSTINLSDLDIVVESDPSNSVSNTNSKNSPPRMNPNAIRSLVSRPAQIEPDAVDMDNTIHYVRGKGILASKREIRVHPDGT